MEIMWWIKQITMKHADFANMNLLKINTFAPEGNVTIIFASIMFTETQFLIWNLY